MRSFLALCLVVTAGCTSGAPLTTDRDTGPAGPLDAGADGGADAAADASPPRPDAGCVEGTVASWALETYDDVIVVYRARITPNVAGDPFDLFVESRRYATSTFTGTFPLGTGDDGNYGTCAHCVVAFTGSAFDHGYFASAGSLTLAADPYDLALSGSLDDVTLVEVAVGADLASTPVPGGGCIHLERVELDQTFGPPGWTCDVSAFEDGTTCDCGCGILDRDCAEGRLPVAGCAPGQLCLPLAEGVIGPFFGRSVCADDCDRGAGVGCPAPHACVDHAFGDLCVADTTLLDALADLGELCRVGALHCAIDPSGFSNGYCDLYDRADRRCRPRCSVDADCDVAALEHCYVVTSENVGGTEIPRGYCALRYPATWTCSGAAYRDGATCDCGCGDLDPDCEDTTLPVVGCAATETCVGGLCQP